MRYSLRAKNSPTKIKHNEAPKGSSITPRNPSLANFAGMPNTVSEPNHVAKTVAMTMYSGSERPAFV